MLRFPVPERFTTADVERLAQLCHLAQVAGPHRDGALGEIVDLRGFNPVKLPHIGESYIYRDSHRRPFTEEEINELPPIPPSLRERARHVPPPVEFEQP